MTPKPWDRQDGEPVKWFEVFEKFRLLGSSRTIDAIYGASKGVEGRKAPGNWRRIAEEWCWNSRVEAWDLHVAEEDRKRNEEAYRGNLRKHQSEALRISDASLLAAGRALQIVNLRLKATLKTLNLDKEGNATNEAELLKLDLDAVIQLLNAASKASKVAVEIKATALGVQELLANLDRLNEQ